MKANIKFFAKKIIATVLISTVALTSVHSIIKADTEDISNTSDILVDELHSYNSSYSSGENYLADGSFENGPWLSEGNGNQSVVYEVTHNSPAALKLVTDGAGKSFKAFYTLDGFDGTKDYKLTASLKTVGVDYGAAHVRVLYRGPGKTMWAKWRNNEKIITTGGTTDWQTYTAVIAATDMPEWITGITIYLWIDGVGTLYVDNVELSTDVAEDDFILKQPEIEGGKYDGILHNGGFEAGAWSYFENAAGNTVAIDTENGYNGSLASLKLDLPEIKGTYAQAVRTQSITVDGSVKNLDTEWVENANGQMETVAPYRVRMFIKTSPDFEGAIYAQISQNGTRKWYNYKTEWYLLGESNGAVNITESGYTNWTQLTTNMFKPTDEGEITVLIGVNGKGTIWIDDVDIIKDPNIDNLVSNGGFENGIWQTWGSVTDTNYENVYAVKDVTCNSPKAGKIEITDYEKAGAAYIVSGIDVGRLDRSKTYKLDFDLKYKGVESETGVQSAILQYYKIQNPDGSFQTDGNGAVKTATAWYRYCGNEQLLKMGGGDMDWTHYSLILNPSGWHENLHSANLFFYLYDEGELWIDNVNMVEWDLSEEILGYISNGEVIITGLKNKSISGDLTIPDTLRGYPVTSIDDYAFQDCSSLLNITIPDSVTNIGDFAFYNCTSLTSIAIPDSVTSIGDSAFSRCSSIKNVYYQGTAEKWEQITGYGGLTDSVIIYFDCTGTPGDVISIEISKLPDKLQYSENEELNLDGGVLTINYNGGATRNIDLTTLEAAGFDKTESGKQTITIKYGEFTAEFEIEIIAHPIYFVAFSKLPNKIYYNRGEALDLTGAKIAVGYTDGTYKIFDVTVNMVSGFRSNRLGVQVLTVNYKGYTMQLIVEVFDKSDFDYDGVISASDMTILKKDLFNESTDLKYDISGDGKFDILDLVKIKKFLLGPSEKENTSSSNNTSSKENISSTIKPSTSSENNSPKYDSSDNSVNRTPSDTTSNTSSEDRASSSQTSSSYNTSIDNLWTDGCSP